DGEVTLSASPAGGTFSGAGVDGGTFDPADAGAGVHTIGYCYTDPDTGCEGCCDFVITVDPDPDVDCPEDITLCEDDFPVNLTGTPAGGTFSGAGVDGGTFDPADAGVGVHTIEYCYTDPDTGCEGCCTFVITVHPIPDVTCPSDMEVCIDEPPFNLTGATPPGGSYNDVNFNPVNPFNPAAFGAGAHTIYYDYIDPNTGCYNYCTFTVTVHPLPVVTCPPNMTVCEEDPQFVLMGAAPAGGAYAGPGVVGGNSFDPGQAGPGLHLITYNYTDPNTGCSNSCTFTITVDPTPNVICPPNMSVCLNSAPFPLAGATPAGGTYFDALGIPLVNFNPAWGAGVYPITYVYTDPITGCTGSCTFFITVLPLPVVNCPADTSICEGDPPFVLSGATPSGGVYTGTGVSFAGGDYWYDPSVWGPGTVTITYTYTDQNGCTNSCTFDITTNFLPDVDCPADMTVCETDSPFPLAGGTPAGGVYTDAAGNTVTVFNPSVGVGNYPIAYTVTDTTGCSNSCTFNISVVAAPQTDCPPDMDVCIRDAAFMLTGAVPAGGTYSGPGISGGMFYPAVAGYGAHLIQYVYTDPATGCSDTCTFSIVVDVDQVIEMTQGWNGISTFITPDDPDIVNMFAPINNSLIILYNLSGLNSVGTLYWPAQGIMPANDWDEYSGYFIKLNQPDTLWLCGPEVIDKTLQVQQGWSLIPMLSTFDVNVEDLFDGVDELVVVKDAAGPGVFWPAFNINSLGHVKPDHSYLVYMSSDAEITYPTTVVGNSAVMPAQAMPDHPWGEIVETPASHVVVFNATSSLIDRGDLIGGFTSSGQLAGVAEADERTGTFALSLFGNDPYSETDTGFGEGEEFSFRLFRPSTGETFDLEVVYNPEMNTGFFTPNGLSEVKELKVSSTGVGSAGVSPVEIFPNPSEGAFNIKGVEGHATVIILNAFGEEIMRDEMKLPSEINMISQPKGMYVVVIRTFDGHEVIRKLIIH
ncbi:MAG: T9SS type A sorting domain-containing protein, partial [Bacteroidales bacterium]